MGGSLYNKIPLGRRGALYNLGRMQIAATVGAVTSLGLILLLIIK
jgi:hypothetical protein